MTTKKARNPAWYEAEIRDVLQQVVHPEEIDWWLNQPNEELGGRTPKSFIEEGRGKIILEFVQDMITGQPG